MASAKRYIVGITGASGALYAQAVVRAVLASGAQCHLCITPFGHRLLSDELGVAATTPDGLAALAGLDGRFTIESLRERGLIYHATNDVGADIGSGSFRHDGMVIVPCSSHTLNQIAHGQGDTIVTRAAAVALKERMKLVIAHRETPLTLIDIRSMETLTLMGAIVCPTNPGFYLMPRSVQDVVDFVAGRLLDLLGVPHDLKVRWEERNRAAR